MKAASGKLYEPFERRTEASPNGRLLRPDTDEGGEQRDLGSGGADGGKGWNQGESARPKHAPDTAPGARDTSGGADTASSNEEAE